MGREELPYGRIELIEYERMQGANLYPMSAPPALGSLMARFETDDLDALLERISGCGVKAVDAVEANPIFGRCRIAAVYSPAGFRLELFERIPA